MTAAPRSLREPKPLAEMTAGERERADAMDVRCLDLCIGMLERVNGVCLPIFPFTVSRHLGPFADIRGKFDFGGYPRRADCAGGKA